MRHLMWPQFERAGLPEALLFGIMAKESNGKVHVDLARRRGRADAVHVRHRAAASAWARTAPASTRATTRAPRPQASAAYLNERMGQLNRSIELALAAYNGGEGRAQRVYNGSGGRNFWDATVYNQFPAETQRLRADGDRRGVAVPASEANTA